MSDADDGNRDRSTEACRTERRQSERRRHLRFPFTAAVEAIEPQSQIIIKARTSDLGLGGCYVDTMNPFAAGTVIKIRLTKDAATFEADAKVIFSQAGMGMGVVFISAVPQQFLIFQNWLNELTEKSLPDLEPPQESEAGPVVANLTKNTNFVLSELLIALTKKRVLSEVEGEAMLQMLRRHATR
jgi:PilZ domain